MNYDLDDMLSYKIKLMFYRIIGLFIVALIILFIYGLIKPENPKTRDDKIIKSAESELRLSNNSKYISSCKKTIKPIVIQENDGDINHE